MQLVAVSDNIFLFLQTLFMTSKPACKKFLKDPSQPLVYLNNKDTFHLGQWFLLQIYLIRSHENFLFLFNIVVHIFL